MPTFFPKGKTNSPDILEGRVDQQLAAFHTYLADIGRQPLPPEDHREQGRQLRTGFPRKRPLVLRTFMQRVGRHAIAVGFPSSPHFASTHGRPSGRGLARPVSGCPCDLVQSLHPAGRTTGSRPCHASGRPRGQSTARQQRAGPTLSIRSPATGSAVTGWTNPECRRCSTPLAPWRLKTASNLAPKGLNEH
ncbi:MAG: hypothetical protein CM1200mP2_48700 [Planctomycetaceae bacterium]|nr:MAG: hypothetical protein CM1200mP2_48700 [Planctomycetaceae bacterium]